jgi:hypothetical protein
MKANRECEEDISTEMPKTVRDMMKEVFHGVGDYCCCEEWRLLGCSSSGMLRRVALVRTDVSEELRASFIRVTRIGKLGTTLAVTCNRVFLRSALVASCS